MPDFPVLRMQSISKRFGATQALQGVSLEVASGEIVALVGENGAGKSTLMKVLSGAHAPDAGEMSLAGAPYRPGGPHDARLAGVAMIYQELNLAADLSVEDNVMLGREERRGMWLMRGAQRARVADALRQLGHADLDLRTPVGRLSPGMQQVVEIARALVHNARIIVFDEPTSSLPLADVRRLFETVRRLKAAGLGIVYISHFLEEVREIADRYTVLRDGQTVGTGRLTEVTDAQIVSLMVGRSVAELFPQVPHAPGDAILSLEGLSGRRAPQGVSLQLRRGEILGIAGLVGAGRTELLRCVYGLDPTHAGQAVLHREKAPWVLRGESTERIRAGLGLVSEDRKNEGLAQGLSIADNLTLSRLAPYSRFGLLRGSARRQAVAQWMTRLAVKARDDAQPVSDLSGGNQQKVAIARALHQEADVLLLDEPTRGIDVGTKAEIYRLIGELAAGGKAIIFVSSYLPELLAVGDRVGVMRRGRLIEIRPAGGWTEESLLAAAVGGEGIA